MYTDQDFDRAKRTMRLRLAASIALLLLFLSGLIVGLVIRNKILAIASTILGGWVFYAHLSLKTMPWVRYTKWLRDMRGGLSRDTDALFVSLSDESRLSDGVEVREMIVRVGSAEEDERLFLWDCDKPAPTLKPDQPVHIRSYGNYVIELSAG